MEPTIFSMEKRGKMQKVATIGKYTYFDKEWENPEYNPSIKRKFFGFFREELPPLKNRNYLAKEKLEKLGFSIINEDPNSFTVVLPEGWHTVEKSDPDHVLFYDQGYNIRVESSLKTFVKFL